MWPLEPSFRYFLGILWGVTTKDKTESFDDLNLFWPESVNYHIDSARPHSSSPRSDGEAKSGNQKPVTTYNGVPRQCVRNAQPLLENEIRVLDLSKGTGGMPLVGSLRKVRLSDPGMYEPLSYTWENYDTVQPSEHNDDDVVHPNLFLSDGSDASVLELTSNCAKALCSVRDPDRDRTVWVDSICVNQDDPQERSRQVDLMKEIYARAFTVLVYLGGESVEEDGSSDTAMTLLGQPDRLKMTGLLNARETTSLRRLFERAYFRRMWIVQEVALAQTIEFHCGSAKTYVSKFAGKPLEAILSFGVTPPWLKHSKHLRSDVTSSQIRLWNQRLSKQPQSEQIFRLIFDTALCDCNDDRDRIFALLSLLNPGDKERLRADYSLSTAHVYTGIAAYLAKNGFLWSVLMLAPRLALNNIRGLPSWVPDWSNVGIQRKIDPGLFGEVLRESHDPELESGFEVSKSGLITIRGMLFGSVTISDDSQVRLLGSAMTSDYSRSRRFHQFAEADSRHSRLLYYNWTPGGSIRGYEDGSLWRLSSPDHKQDKSLDSWKWYFEFATRCKQPTDSTHVAFMLPDYSTVLILRPHYSLRDQYTVVDIGMPLVRTVLPKDWEDYSENDWNSNGLFRGRFPLHFLKPRYDWEQPYWDTIASSQAAFPRLSGFPALWSHNPLTMAMSLTHRAIQTIQNIDMSELYLLQRWQMHARIGIQALSDKTRLRQLVDEVNSLRHEDYRAREKAAGLDHGWSLESFLSLFIRDPFTKEPMDWPHVRLPGNQPLGETDVLAQLMQWAQVTFQYLDGLRKETPDHFRFLELLDDVKLASKAFGVASFHISVANVVARNDAGESRGLPGRTSFLLQKISRQLPDGANTELQTYQRPRFGNECYWDWRRFNSVMEQRSSTLSHVQPDVEKIQANLRGFKPDFGLISAHQVLAAHGFDLRKNDFIQIKIR